jgi:hypothetical protein
MLRDPPKRGKIKEIVFLRTPFEKNNFSIFSPTHRVDLLREKWGEGRELAPRHRGEVDRVDFNKTLVQKDPDLPNPARLW